MDTFTITIVSQLSNSTGQVRLNFPYWTGTVDFYLTSGVVIDPVPRTESTPNILVIPWLHTEMPYSQAIPYDLKALLGATKIQSAIYNGVLRMIRGSPFTDKVVVEIQPIVRAVELINQRQAEIDPDGRLVALRMQVDWQYPQLPENGGNKHVIVVLSKFLIPDQKLLYELTPAQQKTFNADRYVYRLRKMFACTADET